MAAIMIQGCGSDVGKSVIVAGLCRLFANRGLKVRPFKPQNMSNNAAVTADGGEIGRAQALQAMACRTPATVNMNPVLLKPQSDTGAQVVVRGRVAGTWAARAYQEKKPELLDVVLESFAALRTESDLVIVEGAGSPAEINLRRGDIANMGFVIPARSLPRLQLILIIIRNKSMVLSRAPDGLKSRRGHGQGYLAALGQCLAAVERRRGRRDTSAGEWLTDVRAVRAQQHPSVVECG